MNREQVFIGETPMDFDILNTNLNAYIALAKLAAAVIGTSTQINAFTCIPTTPASLNVIVTPGEIYTLAAIDTTPYGSLPANPTVILKQGLLLSNTANLSCPAPSTVGYSVNYLIEIGFQEVDGGSTLLPYYNADNPSQAFSGPANDGLPNNTIRFDNAIVQIKAGTPATSGSQTTPSPDSGFVGAYVVTVAHGATTVTSGNIVLYPGAPFIPTTLSAVPTIVGIQNSQYTYELDTGTANAYAVSTSPTYAAKVGGQLLQVKILNTNTSTSCTLTVNSISTNNIKLQDGSNPYLGAMQAGGIYDFEWDGTNYQLKNPTLSAGIQYTASLHAVDTGTANTYAVTFTPTLQTYTGSQIMSFKALNTNTSTSCTFTVGSLASLNIKLQDGSNPYIGAIEAGGEYFIKFDGTNAQLLNPTPSVAIQNNAYTYYNDTGSANAYAITPIPAISAYQAGQSFSVNIANANIGYALASLAVVAAGSYVTLPTLSFAPIGGGTGAAATCTMFGLNAAAVATAGTGYHVGDTITLAGGTFSAVCVLVVQTLVGGPGTGVASATVSTLGSYTALPSNPVAQSSTSGTGTGATFTMTWGILGTNISNFGAGYIAPPAVIISGSGSGSGLISSTLNTAITLNVSGLGGKNILLNNGKPPTPNQMPAGMLARLSYDGTYFRLENPAPIPDLITSYTGGVSGNYYPPVGAISLEVECVGGGAGGSGSGTGAGGGIGTAGNNTTFGSLTANGGSAGAAAYYGGVGGSASGGDINLSGGCGQPSGENVVSGDSQAPGGGGGNSFYGGSGLGGAIGTIAGGNAGANTGGGGGGGGSSSGAGNVSGAGGGAGGYCRKSISPLTNVYAYSVGGAVSGGTAGTSGAAGGAGASGNIYVRAKYQ